MSNNNDYQDIVRLIREEDDFLVATHVTPDGDAVGSMAAVGHMLSALGKKFVLYNYSGVPASFAFLPLPGRVCRRLADLPGPRPKWTILVDCGILARSGPELENADPATIVNIDHHLANPGYGRLNWVEPDAPAVGEMIASLARGAGLAFSEPLAESIYLALVTDTNHFSYSSTRPETLRLAADLLEAGVAPGKFNDRLENSWSWARYRLWLDILGQTKVFCNGRIAVLRITGQALEHHGATLSDADGMITFAMRPASVVVAVSLRLTENGQIKFSLRSKGAVDVQAIAARFGGGGHPNAAAGLCQGTFDEVEDRLIRTIEGVLRTTENISA